jgi:integrase
MATEVQDYVLAADRENTVRSYASALRNFETVWKGMLPATVDTVARYLAEHASIYRISTLRLHLAALARWHADNGFADPTRSPLVHKVLRGIRSKHGTAQRRARPLQLDVLETVSDWLLEAQALASKHGRRTEQLRRSRDRSLLLLGFWRAFRADELANMRIEEVVAVRGVGLTCRPGRTKTTDEDEERAFHCPALSRLCPVDAYLDWLAVSGLTSGPVYPGIDRWGNVSQQPMKSQAVLPLLRRILEDAGTADADTYSSHSLRRGFAGWASANGWELKELMEHVGWRDVNSALRYIDIPQDSMKSKFERGLANSATAPTQMPELPAPNTAPMLAQAPARTQRFATIQLRLLLTKPGGTRQGTERAQRQIESVHLVKFGARQIDRDGRRFELQVPFHDRDNLDETLLDLLDELYRVAMACECLLEASLHEPETDTTWD